MLVPEFALKLQEGGGLELTLILTTFGFGLRHGIDWDHIAAITDITGSQVSPRRGMRFATLYAFGHGFVVFALGFAAIGLGAKLPAGIDGAMERVVGVTLLLLGVYVFYSLIRDRSDFRMRSKWMLLFAGVRRLVVAVRGRHSEPEPIVVIHAHEHDHEDRLHAAHDVISGPAFSKGQVATKLRVHRHRHLHRGSMPDDPFMEYGTLTSLLVGMVHGIGAETPTQVLVFLTAVGVGGKALGSLLLATFLLGLFASNTLIGLASSFGFLRATRSFVLYASIAVITGGFSLALGALFLLGRGNLLPAILGG
jgi:hypothetical protein